MEGGGKKIDSHLIYPVFSYVSFSQSEKVNVSLIFVITSLPGKLPPAALRIFIAVRTVFNAV